MIIEITIENNHDYVALMQPYEKEFAPITKIEPGADGLYPPSTPVDDTHSGFLYYIDGKAVGFIVVYVGQQPYDVSEMFVLPPYRIQGIAQALAIHAFQTFPGEWQVRQLKEATNARAFWLKMLTHFTHNHFTEEVVPDETWGEVYRQQFVVTECNTAKTKPKKNH